MWIENDKFDKIRLSFSKCTNHDGSSFNVCFFARQLDGDSGNIMTETDWDQVQLQVSEKN